MLAQSAAVKKKTTISVPPACGIASEIDTSADLSHPSYSGGLCIETILWRIA
jgi:hypothetical protein